MAWVIAFFGVIIIVIGLWAIAPPGAVIGFISRWLTWAGVWGGSLLRVLLAMAFWFAAEASQTPVVLRVFAVVSLLAGITLPFVGSSQRRAWIAWLALRPDRFTREWAMVAVLWGGISRVGRLPKFEGPLVSQLRCLVMRGTLISQRTVWLAHKRFNECAT